MEPDVAREGLRRLQPLRRLAAALSPDPGSDVGRVCALESAHYMRDQLLRDADWAGMAHGVEIRVPLVDTRLLEQLAPAIPRLAPQTGKAALAKAPALALPAAIVARAKTGFGVPTGAWLRGVPLTPRGLASRGWSQTVLHGFA
jgi:asparagine synthase (glutamine-hydrolysing)